MVKNIAILTFSLFSIIFSCAQKDTQNYQGNWIGHLSNRTSFNFKITLQQSEANTYRIRIANENTIYDKTLKSTSKQSIRIPVGEGVDMYLNAINNRQALSGFIKSGRYYYHILLHDTGNNTFVGDWNPFMLNNGMISDDIFLYTENNDDGSYVAYPFFGDQRFRGTWTDQFTKEGNTLVFKDSNTGFNFRGIVSGNTIDLQIYIADAMVTSAILTHDTEEWEYKTDPLDKNQNTNRPQQLNDGWATANCDDTNISTSELAKLIEDIQSYKLVNTHSVLIAKEEKLVFEAYFDGHNAHIPHDLRSASKSISSAIIGIAINDGIIKSVDETIYDFLPKTYDYTKDDLKSKIKIKDLLTMSSGLDVNNLASENYYQDPRSNSKDWLTAVLEAPMVHTPGTYADYGSANPFLLGVCLSERLDQPVEVYMDEKLFEPLGITSYINQTDDTNSRPYFGGGMLLTSRDLLKFGQLYLNKGQWKGKQIVPKEWVEASTKKYVRLQDYEDKNEYGYQWWHDTYTVNGKAIASIEARGAGGQFIFILPELDTVIVITSGNFRNRKGNQPRDILKDYILPAIVS